MAEIFGTPQNNWNYVALVTETGDLSSVGWYALHGWPGTIPSLTPPETEAEDQSQDPPGQAMLALIENAADVPSISEEATIAGAFVPTPSSNATQHIVGRWEDGGEAWRIFYDGSEAPPTINYQTKSGDSQVDSMTYELDPADETIFFVFRRKTGLSQEVIHEMWINGRLTQGAGTVAEEPDVGSGDLTIGARHDGVDWTDAFDGQINQVALWDAFVTDAELSLILHTMAHRTEVKFLGTPIPSDLRTQPYPDSNANEVPPRPVLGRKPIAVISLTGSADMYLESAYGQDPDWRRTTSNSIVRRLSRNIRDAINACDDLRSCSDCRPGSINSTFSTATSSPARRTEIFSAMSR